VTTHSGDVARSNFLDAEGWVVTCDACPYQTPVFGRRDDAVTTFRLAHALKGQVSIVLETPEYTVPDPACSVCGQTLLGNPGYCAVCADDIAARAAERDAEWWNDAD
jgi:ribosomal protein S27E